jgi:uncharacterized protein DUF1579
VKKFAIAGLVMTLLAGAALAAEETPKLPAPEKEHLWLQQCVGEWESEAEVMMEPGKPPVKCKGTEKTRSLGGFWVVGEGESEMMGMSFKNVMTLGYDAQKKKYVGTWVDSMTSHMWHYEGTVDASGKILTLNSEGPCPCNPGQVVKVREVVEFKNKDHRVFTSSMQGPDGKWNTVVTVNSWRKKQTPVCKD